MPHTTFPPAAVRLRHAHARFLHCRRVAGVALKIYGVQGPGNALAESVVHCATALAAREIEAQSFPDQANGAGFLIVDASGGRLHATLDLWVRETELLHAAFVAPRGAPDSWEPPPPGETTLSSPYLTLLAHEQRAWTRHVVARAHDPDFAAYLADAPAGSMRRRAAEHAVTRGAAPTPARPSARR